MSCEPSNSELVSIPCDFVASQSALDFFTVFAGIGAVGVLIYGVIVTRRTRSPLYAWLVLSSAMCVFIEPLGDIVGGIYIPAEARVRLFTLLDRPMPIGDLFVWVGMAAGFYISYQLMLRGASVRQLVSFAAALGVAELVIEIGMAQTGAWIYYSNHALVLGVPVSTIAQNVGITIVGGAALMMLMSHVRGVRWLVFFTFVPSVMMGYAFATTVPAYIAIHSEVGPVVGWLLGLTAAGLNLLVAYAAMHIEPVARLRAAAHANRNMSPKAANPALAGRHH